MNDNANPTSMFFVKSFSLKSGRKGWQLIGHSALFYSVVCPEQRICPEIDDMKFVNDGRSLRQNRRYKNMLNNITVRLR